jgi:peptidoglycan biosynthesis protein MviN/MurJ (putative lipid II flippase)
MGLLFVALSLNPAVMADGGPVGLPAWAGQTMSKLIALLIVSLFYLMPDLDHPTLALALAVVSLQGLVRGVIRLATALRAHEPGETGHLLWRLVLPISAYAIAIAISCALAFGAVDWVDGLVVAVFLLVSSAAGATWALLLEMGKRESRSRGGGEAES